MWVTAAARLRAVWGSIRRRRAGGNPTAGERTGYVGAAVATVGSGGRLRVEKEFGDGHRVCLLVEVPTRGPVPAGESPTWADDRHDQPSATVEVASVLDRTRKALRQQVIEREAHRHRTEEEFSEFYRANIKPLVGISDAAMGIDCPGCGSDAGSDSRGVQPLVGDPFASSVGLYGRRQRTGALGTATTRRPCGNHA